MRHEWRVRAVLVEEALAARNCPTVIAVIKNNRVFRQTISPKICEDFPERGIGAGDVVEIVCDVGANCRGVGQIGRHADLRRIGHLRRLLVQTTLVGLLKIENREERLPRRAMTPMRRFVILIPRGIPRRRRVVIGLGIVRGEVARRAEILGEKFHARGQRLFAAHVLRAHAAGVASRDNAGARWRADCGRRVTPLE